MVTEKGTGEKGVCAQWKERQGKKREAWSKKYLKMKKEISNVVWGYKSRGEEQKINEQKEKIWGKAYY